MSVDIRKIFTGETSSLCAETVFSMADVDVAGNFPFVSDIRAQAVITASAGAAKLDADVTYTFCMPCDRCAEEVTLQKKHHFTHLLVRTVNDDDDDTYVVVENDLLDLDELLYTDIILELPSKFLCREDCRGLCPQCGANLNKTTCSCVSKEIDPRLEVLKKFMN